MFPRFVILAALLSVISITGRAQDSPSLGDLARQNRNQKNSSTQSKKIVTNEDIPTASPDSILGLDTSAGIGTSTTPGAEPSPQAALAKWETAVNTIEGMDNATLAKGVLQGGNPDFPGRAAWEARLVAARQTYVSEEKELIQRAKDLLASTQALKNSQAAADDPRGKEILEKFKGIMQETIKSNAAFQAVFMEGRDLARQAPAH